MTTEVGNKVVLKDKSLKQILSFPKIKKLQLDKGQVMENDCKWFDKFFFVERGILFLGNKGNKKIKIKLKN